MFDVAEGTILPPYMSAVIEFSRLAEKYFPGYWRLELKQFDNNITYVSIELNNADANDNTIGYALAFPADCTTAKFMVESAIRELEGAINSSAYLLVRSGECRARKESDDVDKRDCRAN